MMLELFGKVGGTSDGKGGSKAPLDHDPDAVAGGRRWRMARRFLRRCRCALAFQAAHQWPGAKSVRFSDDALCLIGADEAQVDRDYAFLADVSARDPGLWVIA